MVQLGLSTNFKNQVLQQDGDTLPIKEPRGNLGQEYIDSSEMRKVVMQTVEPVPTREATTRLVKILDSTYARSDLENVDANTTQLNAEYITQLLSLLKNF